MIDAFLLEAMREVDEMLPGTPRISPEPRYEPLGEKIRRYICESRTSTDGIHLCTYDFFALVQHVAPERMSPTLDALRLMTVRGPVKVFCDDRALRLFY